MATSSPDRPTGERTIGQWAHSRQPLVGCQLVGVCLLYRGWATALPLPTLYWICFCWSTACGRVCTNAPSHCACVRLPRTAPLICVQRACFEQRSIPEGVISL